DGAYERLRMALLRVKEHPDLGDAVRDQLTKKLQTNLRDVSNQGTQIKLKLAEQAAAKAAALAATDKDMLRKTEEERFEARFKVYKNLMNEARYDILRRQAATEEILKGMMQIQEEAKVKGMRVPLASQVAYTQTLASYNLAVQEDLRPERERNFLAIMLEVEKAHIPLPDEPPIHFMTRLPVSQQIKAWKLLTQRPQELYGDAADFLDDREGRTAANDV